MIETEAEGDLAGIARYRLYADKNIDAVPVEFGTLFIIRFVDEILQHNTAAVFKQQQAVFRLDGKHFRNRQAVS